MVNAGMLHDREDFYVLFRIKVIAIMGAGRRCGNGSTPGGGAARGIVANHPDGATLPGQLLLRRRSPKPVAATDLPAAMPAGRGQAGRTRIACVRGTIPGPRFVTSDQAPNVRSGLRSAGRTETRRRQ